MARVLFFWFLPRCAPTVTSPAPIYFAQLSRLVDSLSVYTNHDEAHFGCMVGEDLAPYPWPTPRRYQSPSASQYSGSLRKFRGRSYSSANAVNQRDSGQEIRCASSIVYGLLTTNFQAGAICNGSSSIKPYPKAGLISGIICDAKSFVAVSTLISEHGAIFILTCSRGPTASTQHGGLSFPGGKV